MKLPRDPVELPQSPDRVYYALGTLLGADDFLDEQSYHRGRLARALAALHGGGTVAGLHVDWVKPANGKAEELEVMPGIALDRFGRLIDVPRKWCIRLEKWWKAQQIADLNGGFHAARNAVVADVFIKFEPCDRGRTPAFASTSYDSINPVTAARVRDGFHIDLIPRRVLSEPDALWEGIAPGAAKAAVQERIFRAGKELGRDYDKDVWEPQAEHEPGIDTTSLLIARVDIPATAAADDKNPPKRAAADVTVNNNIRRFVYPPSLLAQLLGL